MAAVVGTRLGLVLDATAADGSSQTLIDVDKTIAGCERILVGVKALNRRRLIRTGLSP